MTTRIDALNRRQPAATETPEARGRGRSPFAAYRALVWTLGIVAALSTSAAAQLEWSQGGALGLTLVLDDGSSVIEVADAETVRIDSNGYAGSWVYITMTYVVDEAQSGPNEALRAELLALYPFLEVSPTDIESIHSDLPQAADDHPVYSPDQVLEIHEVTMTPPLFDDVVKYFCQPILSPAGPTAQDTRRWNAEAVVWGQYPYPALQGTWAELVYQQGGEATRFDVNHLVELALEDQADDSTQVRAFFREPRTELGGFTGDFAARVVGGRLQLQAVAVRSTDPELQVAEETTADGLKGLGGSPSGPLMPTISLSNPAFVTLTSPGSTGDPRLTVNALGPHALTRGQASPIPMSPAGYMGVTVTFRDSLNTVYEVPVVYYAPGDWRITPPPTTALGPAEILLIGSTLPGAVIHGNGEPWTELAINLGSGGGKL